LQLKEAVVNMAIIHCLEEMNAILTTSREIEKK
jgi:hypothetical protein